MCHWRAKTRLAIIQSPLKQWRAKPELLPQTKQSQSLRLLTNMLPNKLLLVTCADITNIIGCTTLYYRVTEFVLCDSEERHIFNILHIYTAVPALHLLIFALCSRSFSVCLSIDGIELPQKNNITSSSSHTGCAAAEPILPPLPGPVGCC